MAAGAEPAVLVRAVGPRPWRIRPAPALLDGNVSLRAAQACAPFLAGNAVGFWLEPAAPIELRVDGRKARCSDASAQVAMVGDELVVTLDTALEVEPIGGSIELSATKNRADARASIDRHTFSSRQRIRCTIRVRKRWLDRDVTLDGPLASLTMIEPRARWRAADRDVARAMVERHASFFDPTYFAQKRSGATKRYRSMSRAHERSLVDPTLADAMLCPLGADVAMDDGAIILRTECAIDAENFGAITRCRCDSKALEARADAIGRALSSLGAPLERGDPALVYLSQYVVGHTHGDPHVLVKPSALAAVRDDWCLLIDCDAEGGLRGVTEAAWFHAVPCVFVAREAVKIGVGSTLARVRALPRAMLAPSLVWQ